MPLKLRLGLSERRRTASSNISESTEKVTPVFDLGVRGLAPDPKSLSDLQPEPSPNHIAEWKISPPSQLQAKNAPGLGQSVL